MKKRWFIWASVVVYFQSSFAPLSFILIDTKKVTAVMKKTFFTVLLLCFLPVQHGWAKTFGGADATLLDDDSFVSAQDDSELIRVSSLYMGHYQVIKGKPSAWILKGNFQAIRFDNYAILDHQIFSIGGGLYHQFNRKNSLMLHLDLISKQFELDPLDGEVYKTKASLKQKIAANFDVKETLTLEYGDSASDSNTYAGVGLNTTATWAPLKDTSVSAGVSWNKKIYEVEVADERSNQQLTLAVTQSFMRFAYLRVGATRKRNENSDNGYTFYNTLLNGSLGVKF